MKVGAILYHKDIQKYRTAWVDKCVSSLELQTYQNFDVMELCYADSNNTTTVSQYIGRMPEFTKHLSHSFPLPNHVHAQNLLLDWAFKYSDYDFIFNVNLDDYYDRRRIELQLAMIQQGYDLVASNFQHVSENAHGFDVGGVVFPAASYSVGEELLKGHNVIGHSSVCYSRNFWLTFGTYPDTIPHEDLDLWQAAVNRGAVLGVCPETLMYYRRHAEQICK